MKKLLAPVVAATMIGIWIPAPVGAASQNEIVTTVLYDGTDTVDAPFGDSAGSLTPSGTAPEAHTPGLDAGPNNLVVRSNDQFAIRVDWNINEEAATGAFLTIELPEVSDVRTLETEVASWTVDSTGSYAGCLTTEFQDRNGATVGANSPDARIAVCELGDQPEGSNGVIRPTAVIHPTVDGLTFDVSATLTTNDDATGVSDGLAQSLTVSEAPFVDYIKQAPVAGDIPGGTVLLYPLTAVDYSQGPLPFIGAGHIDDGETVTIYDHMWGMTDNTRLATQAEVTEAGFAGTQCGNYAGAGPYIDGSLATSGTWSCTDLGDGGTGYGVVQIDVSGFDSLPAPTTLADSSANSGFPQFTSGQIALYIPQADADIAAANAAILTNSIADQDDGTTITDISQVVEPPAYGFGGLENNLGPTENNHAIFAFATATGAPGPFGTNNDIRWLPGPLELQEVTMPSGNTYLGYNRPGDGVNRNIITGSDRRFHWAGGGGTQNIGQVSRGQLLTLESHVGVNSNDPLDLALHNCVALDTEHYVVVDLPAEIVVAERGANAGAPTGYSTTTASHGIVHVEAGNFTHAFTAAGGNIWTGRTFETTDSWDYRVEVANIGVPTVAAGVGIDEDALTCNDADATWVDASNAAALAAFDQDGLPGYELITHYRIVSDELVGVEANDDAGGDNGGFGFASFINVQVKTDFADNADDEELFAFNSHSYGDTAWTGTAAVPNDNCRPYDAGWFGTNATATGWCNNRFHEQPNSMTSVGYDLASRNSLRAANSQVQLASGTLVEIVGVAPQLVKTNVDGLADIANNGQLVQYRLSPSAVGSAQEALIDVVLTDDLNNITMTGFDDGAYYEFVRFVQQPTTAGATCTEAGNVIECRYSQDPDSPDASLPAGLPGGWPTAADGSADVIIEVMVTGAIANPDQATVLTNTATLNTDQTVTWEPGAAAIDGAPAGGALFVDALQDAVSTASSFMPLPADEGAIIKAVETLEGPCVLSPDPASTLAEWQERCSMIDFDDGLMSFTLTLENEGNTQFTNIQIVDVFPYNGDSTEPASFTSDPADDPDGSAPTIGDGRTPATDVAAGATLSYVGLTGADDVWVTYAPSATVSRDPAMATSLTETSPGVPIAGAVTWCNGVGGAYVAGPDDGSCVSGATADDVTATLSTFAGPLNPDDSIEHTLTLQSAGHECDDLWTNTFGARVDEIFLPIRSNDVSIMVNCEFDLALAKTIAPAFTPGADWLTPGTTVIPFLMTVTNQGDPVEDFHVTDYVDTDVFTFDPAENPASVTSGSQTHDFVWVTTDLAAPVAQVDGVLLNGESVTIPVNLTVSALPGVLENWAEISYFDSDGDPSNGDSDLTNPNNPATGPLTDEDSTPDADQTDDAQPDGYGQPGDDVILGDGSGDDPITGDEDDHDVAGLPYYDLEFIKTIASTDVSAAPPTVTYNLTVNNQSSVEVYNVDVTDHGAPGLVYDSSSVAPLAAVTPQTFRIPGPIAAGDSAVVTVTYIMDDLNLGPFTNVAEISAFDDDADPNNALSPFAVDVDSTPDDLPGNDDVIDHDIDNYDPDDDGNLNEPTPGDEDDHDIETVGFYDLALAKTFQSMGTPLLPNGTVTMLITVTNQGFPVEQIDVTDYLDPALWAGFEASLNPGAAIDGSSTATNGFSFTWDGSDAQNPVALVTADVPGEPLLFNETVAIPITVRVADTFDGSQSLINIAEISRFDNDSDASNGDSDAAGTGELLFDNDSTPDDEDESNDGETIGADLVDDAINDPNDEDDHDPVVIPVMDLALRKTLDPSTEFPIAAGSQVTFSVEVFNQGATHASNITLTDYVDPAKWEAFDVTLNPAGGGYSWAAAANGQDGLVTITTVLAPGASITVPVTLTIAAGADLETLSNTAEISSQTATDASGDEIFNPDGSTVVDIDSVPDATNDDTLVDDVIDGTSGDEDDHDVAFVTPPTYSLGNQVWNDADNNGTLDPGEEPIDGVVVHLFTDEDGDGQPDDLNGDGIIDEDDAIATDTTGPDGDYLFTDLPAGEYIVGIAPENWAEGGALDNWLSSDPTSTDPNDGVDNNDDGTPDRSSGYVFSGPVTLDDSEPLNEPGLDNDPNTPDGLSNLTVDFGFWQPVFDLALEKTVAPGQDVSALEIGDSVTFRIEVFNQGNINATDVTVVDYVPAGLALDDPDWTMGSNSAATIDLTGVSIAPGSSTTVDITMKIVAAGEIDNHAEITGATPVDADGNPLTEPDGTLIEDIDSTPDAENTDVLSDGVTNGAGGDEDDHDVARIFVQETPAGELPTTGSDPRGFMNWAAALLILGAVLGLLGRRRKLTVSHS